MKLRGFRIELGEVEKALNGHPGVVHAVVAVQGEGAGKRLVAYVVLDPEREPSRSDLRSFLQDRLPEYMIPAAFVPMRSLPLNPSGKVDHKALPAPEQSALSQESGFVPPGTPEEEILASIWSQVLGVKRIGKHDNFFELGGHSLLATQIMSRLPKTFHVELPIRVLFENPTVGELASCVREAMLASRGIQRPAIEPASRDHPLPLSYAQQRLWFLDQLEPDSPSYNLPMAVRSLGPLDVRALERSLNDLLNAMRS